MKSAQHPIFTPICFIDCFGFFIIIKAFYRPTHHSAKVYVAGYLPPIISLQCPAPANNNGLDALATIERIYQKLEEEQN